MVNSKIGQSIYLHLGSCVEEYVIVGYNKDIYDIEPSYLYRAKSQFNLNKIWKLLPVEHETYQIKLFDKHQVGSHSKFPLGWRFTHCPNNSHYFSLEAPINHDLTSRTRILNLLTIQYPDLIFAHQNIIDQKIFKSIMLDFKSINLIIDHILDTQPIKIYLNDHQITFKSYNHLETLTFTNHQIVQQIITYTFGI